VPRYVIERDFGLVGEEEMQEVAARSKATGIEHFPDIEWEHSHVCSDEKGAIKSFCVYSAPSVERLREHAERVGGHVVTNVFEIVGTSPRGGQALTLCVPGEMVIGSDRVSGRAVSAKRWVRAWYASARLSAMIRRRSWSSGSSESARLKRSTASA